MPDSRRGSATVCALMVLRSHTELIEEVARNLRPAPRIRTAATAVVAEVNARGGPAFNGVHLRVEADANFQTYATGTEVRSCG